MYKSKSKSKLQAITHYVDAAVLQSNHHRGTVNSIPSLLLTKNSRTFPGLPRTPKTFLQDSIVAQHVKLQTNSSYLLYIYSATVQSIAKCSSQVAKKLFA